MDSLTQITLGAAVGEAVLGRRLGGKAALWGALAGTIPDLDILLNPFVDPVQQLAVHRGFSHSIVFSVVFAPVLGWCIARVHGRQDVSLRTATRLAFLGFFTHITLDTFTVYGTQVFQPFSDYPLSFSSIFIIDPLYTVPLLIGLLVALRLGRAAPGRRRAVWAGLLVSTLYLGSTVAGKLSAEKAFRAGLRAQDIAYSRMMSMPTPLNSVLWACIAEVEDGYRVGLYSLLDSAPPEDFLFVPRHGERLDGHRAEQAVETLFWFSKGYYTVIESEGAVVFNDLRFGRSDVWLADTGAYVFQFRLIADPATGRYTSFAQQPPAIDGIRRSLGQMLRRLRGRP